MTLRSDFNIVASTPQPSNAELSRKPIVEETLPGGGSTPGLTSLLQETDREIETGQEASSTSGAGKGGSSHRRVAFLVTHGMGQQVPFETLSALGQALITEHAKRHPAAGGGSGMQANVRRVRLTSTEGAPELSRVEIVLPTDAGKSVEAHIYESYWAPFTEGQISFLETASFLYSAGLNGILTYIRAWWRKKGQKGNPQTKSRQTLSRRAADSLKHFDRWMFGEFRDMAIKRWTFWALAAIVASVSLLLLPALLVFTPWGWYVDKWLFSRYASPFGSIQALQWPHWSEVAVGILLVVFLGFAWWVRYFVVEYVGDVAIYVSSYKVSRFDGIRNEILEETCSVAQQIYSAGICDQTQPAYDSIVIVGHSLGSVISYDALNACINWDQIDCGFKRMVVSRTTRFITFGSPLDKTAFLFRTQVSSARNLREALAARQQPLILDYAKFRPSASFRWINIYSPRDIISGNLDYYDAPAAAHLAGYNPVNNIKDPDARIPLLAHIQYWENPTLHECLYEAAWTPAANGLSYLAGSASLHSPLSPMVQAYTSSVKNAPAAYPPSP